MKPNLALLSTARAALFRASARAPYTTAVMAFSGGLDSCVLLHLLATPGVLPAHVQLRAIHINHHLQPAAETFAEHCAQLCQQWAIPLTTIDVCVSPNTGLGWEAAARNSRYSAFESALGADELLVLAHHADDQIETFFLNLMRGSGLDGLSGMPSERPLGAGRLIRPLLNEPLHKLHEYAVTQQIQWIEDPTNHEEGFDRNYLRTAVLPQLLKRWPQAHASILKSIEFQQSARNQLREITATQFAACSPAPDQLDLLLLSELSNAEQRQVVRYWLASAGAPFPGRRRLEQALHDLLTAAIDKQPALIWSNYRIDRFDSRLYLRRSEPLPAEGLLPRPCMSDHPIGFGDLGVFELKLVQGQGIAAHRLNPAELTVRLRQGKERVCPGKNQPRRRLKNWLAEARIPPWERDQLPLLMWGDVVVCVADRLICYPFSEEVAADEPSYLPVWVPCNRN